MAGFLEYAFHWRDKDQLPSLEDIFTTIDLSANTGHHLGRRYGPRKLRALRRLLIYRVFSILDRRYHGSVDIDRFLEAELGDAEPATTAFVVMNWDIALENHLTSRYPHLAIDYCIDAQPWPGSKALTGPQSLAVAKVHGSSNWVYCDNCRRLYYDISSKLSLRIQAGLLKADLRLFDQSVSDRINRNVSGTRSAKACPYCKVVVGPHIATFSFRKSFRTHAFQGTWAAAERILSDAKRWLFVGYSLPPADFEFKHLLKTAELKGQVKKLSAKKIEVILFNDPVAEVNYRTFFGPRVVQICQNGLANCI